MSWTSYKQHICFLYKHFQLRCVNSWLIIRLVEPKAVVFECGANCGCNHNCVNRTSQQGLQYRLEVGISLCFYMCSPRLHSFTTWRSEGLNHLGQCSLFSFLVIKLYEWVLYEVFPFFLLSPPGFVTFFLLSPPGSVTV